MLNVALRLVEGAEMDREKALEAAISQIERGFGKGSIMRLGQNDKAVEVEAISTGSLGLDIALGIGGGAPGPALPNSCSPAPSQNPPPPPLRGPGAAPARAFPSPSS